MEDDQEDELLNGERSFRALRHYRRVKARAKQTVFMPVHADRKPILRAVNRAIQVLLDERMIYVVRMYDVDEVINLHKDFKWDGEVVYNTEYIRANQGQVNCKLEEAGLRYTVLSRFSNFSFEELFLVDGQVQWDFLRQLRPFGHEQLQVPVDEQPVPVDENEWVLEIQVPPGEQPPVPVDDQPPVPVDDQPPVPVDEQPPVPVDEQPPVPVDEQPPVSMDEE